MHVMARLGGAALLLLGCLFAAAGCDTFEPESPAPAASALEATANAPGPPAKAPDDAEARALARAAMAPLLAYAKHCKIDHCFGWGLWDAASDACEGDRTDLAKAAADAAAPLVAHVDAHPELDGKAKTFTTHARLLAELAQTTPYRGVLAPFQAAATAYNAWMTAEPVEVDPVEEVICTADRSYTYKLSKKYPRVRRPIPWARCNGVACFPTAGE